MITLKDYQTRALDSLRDFLRQCSKDGRPEGAFQEVQVRNGRPPVPYIPVHVQGLRPEMPYVCLRLPTGGGKTLLACHASGIAMGELLHAERAVVLWLVPSNTILDQTADALRDPRHPYRRITPQPYFGADAPASVHGPPEACLRPSRQIHGHAGALPAADTGHPR